MIRNPGRLREQPEAAPATPGKPPDTGSNVRRQGTRGTRTATRTAHRTQPYRIRPSDIVMRRSAMAARCSSWVTITMVCPSRSRSSKKDGVSRRGCANRGCPRVRRPAARRGIDQGPCDGHALLLAAGKLAGLMVAAPGETHHFQQLRGAAFDLRTGVFADQPWMQTFSKAVNSGSRWWNWNTKPMRPLRNRDNVLSPSEKHPARRFRPVRRRAAKAYPRSATAWSCRRRWHRRSKRPRPGRRRAKRLSALRGRRSACVYR